MLSVIDFFYIETALQVCVAFHLVFLIFLYNEISERAIKMHTRFSSICLFYYAVVFCGLYLNCRLVVFSICYALYTYYVPNVNLWCQSVLFYNCVVYDILALFLVSGFVKLYAIFIIFYLIIFNIFLLMIMISSCCECIASRPMSCLWFNISTLLV